MGGQKQLTGVRGTQRERGAEGVRGNAGAATKMASKGEMLWIDVEIEFLYTFIGEL